MPLSALLTWGSCTTREGERAFWECDSPILKHKHRLAQTNCSPSLCLDYTGHFMCLVQMLVSHCISPLRALTALISLGTWPRGLPPPCPQPKTPLQPTGWEWGRGSGHPLWWRAGVGDTEVGNIASRCCLLGAGRGSVTWLILWSGAAILPVQQVVGTLPSPAGSATSPSWGGCRSLTLSLWLPGQPGRRHLCCCASEGVRHHFWDDTTM